MSDDKGDKINESAPAGGEQADAASTAAESQTAAASAVDADQSTEAAAADKLSDLMADGSAPAQGNDLEQQALRAAEHAVAESERALAEARELLRRPVGARSAAPTARPRNNRELAMRMLLAVNVVAMMVVAMLPSSGAEPSTEPAAPTTVETPVVETPDSGGEATRMSVPWNRALRASERGEWQAATAILEAYLNDNPRMPPGEKLPVLLTLSGYSARFDYKKSRHYAQQAQALEQSHYLPEDLVRSAEVALESGDQETLRRVWARFLLQQRQIPSWLYQHVARAYLQLGDSYRMDADAVEAKLRQQQLEEIAAQLRAEARAGGGGGK